MKKYNYISFDMGSESMAAYYQMAEEAEGERIDLQAYAQSLITLSGENIKEEDIYYLREDDGSKSYRLRNRISISDRRQPKNLPIDHARMDFIRVKDKYINFVDDSGGEKLYHKSLFKYFFHKDEILDRNMLPNPKIAFQEGAGQVIPEIESNQAPDYKKVSHKPEILIQHLMTQIIRNFVLKSPQLRDKELRNENTYLLLTIPNVYSLSHARSIADFIKKCTRFDKVETIYESDAVSYFVLYAMKNNLIVKKFFEKIRKLKKRGSIDNCFQVLAFDIGHGTTDLSLMEIIEPEQEKSESSEDGTERPRHFYVKARTGKSEGGARLNYILAEYYNSCLNELLDKPAFRDFKLDFDFIHGTREGKLTDKQAKIINALENLVDAVKKSMDENYAITLSPKKQKELINAIIDEWFKPYDSPEAAEKIKNDLFRGEFIETFLLEKLPGPIKSFFFNLLFDLFGAFLKTKFTAWRKTIKLAGLRKKIEDYVNSNVKGTLNQLIEMALDRENIEPSRGKWRIISRAPTLAVIAGQASQFKPLKKAIEMELNNLHIPASCRVFLEGKEAKEACCKGAVTYKRSSDICTNATEIHGIYGFINEIEAISNVYAILDTKKLNSGNPVINKFNNTST
ncbi:MAG: hypothetical protein L0Y73_08770, partial [Candidatus Aminicenantes bacterium]|nr:hypothetical protein [Candidatus Aminicenantes bacterium]